MSVNEFQTCLLKCKKTLIVLVVLSILMCNLFLGMKQSYTAEVYIKYPGEQATHGLAHDDTTLDPYEISNSLVITRALAELGISAANPDSIRKSISITPITTLSEDEKYASWIDSFADYENNEDDKTHPVHYSVTFRSDKGKDYVTKMLGALLNQYRIYYAEQHGTQRDVIALSDASVLNYDYLETAEILQDKITANIKNLQGIADAVPSFRSPTTGYAPVDLIGDYNFIMTTDLASVTKKIIDFGISKDSAVLRKSLQNKADNSLLSSIQYGEQAGTQRELMTIYSQKNREYTWETAYNSGRAEGNQVREDTERDRTYQRDEITYDNLVLEFVDFSIKSSEAVFDKADYEANIGRFVNNTEDPATQQELTDVYTQYRELHGITESLIKDYNQYIAGQYIAQISGISATKTIAEAFYYAVSVVLALCLGVFVIVFTELKRKNVI